MAASAHRNNFDLLRLFFALSVLLVHTFEVSRVAAMEGVQALFNSRIALQGFFVISGYLVYQSFDTTKGIKRYFEKRARRIYPAYAVIVVLMALLGFFLTTKGAGEYLSDLAFWKYLGANLVFLNFLAPNLPGVFENPPHVLSAINGALWTIKLEVLFYLLVPLLGWAAARTKPWATFLFFYLASVGFVFAAQDHRELQAQLPGQLGFFIAGAALYVYRMWFSKHAVMLLLPAIAIMVFFSPPPGFYFENAISALLYPAALGVGVVFVATQIPYLGNFARYGDFSYGVYITHYPLIQILIGFGLFATNPYLALALSVLGAGGLAFLMWHGVEKRFLHRSSHYIKSAHAAD